MIAGFDNQGAIFRQIDGHKRQQTPLDASKSASVYFSDSGLFNGLRAIQIKKFPGFAPRALVVA
jgi:hypothetical protein